MERVRRSIWCESEDQNGILAIRFRQSSARSSAQIRINASTTARIGAFWGITAPGLLPPNATNEASAFGIVRLSWLTRIRDCDAARCKTTSSLKQSNRETIQSRRLSQLKTYARLVAQGRLDYDPRQVVVGLKPDAQCFARSFVKLSWRACSRRAYSSGRLPLNGGTARSSAASPSRMLESTSFSRAR